MVAQLLEVAEHLSTRVAGPVAAQVFEAATCANGFDGVSTIARRSCEFVWCIAVCACAVASSFCVASAVGAGAAFGSE